MRGSQLKSPFGFRKNAPRRPVDPPEHDPPYPPWRLAMRVGAKRMAADPWQSYERVGAATRDAVLRRLPDGWSFEGKRFLDFGCGAGRTLRHFLEEGQVGEVHGCDLDAESIEWVDRHLSPPVHAFQNGERPPLPLADLSVDLILCASVFTHIATGWADWATEMHRLLKDDGLLIVTIIGPENGSKLPFASIGDATVDEDHVGMNAFGVGRPGAAPVVVHSEWWFRAHWGRAFEILELAEAGFRHPGDQGYVLMRKRQREVTPQMLVSLEPDEPREALAARENVAQLSAELEYAWEAWEELRAQSASSPDP